MFLHHVISPCFYSSPKHTNQTLAQDFALFAHLKWDCDLRGLQSTTTTLDATKSDILALSDLSSVQDSLRSPCTQRAQDDLKL